MQTEHLVKSKERMKIAMNVILGIIITLFP